MAGTINISGYQTQTPTGTVTIGPFTIPCSNIQQSTELVLANGDNVIANPPEIVGIFSGGVIIVPSPSSVVTMILSTSGIGAGGVHISPTLPTLWSFDPANLPTNFHIFTNTTPTLPTTFTWF